ncbi:hypothetical protein LTR37_000955 [Vermiconidia calcicola]|uniref:Uncharacterized protein n=1 Tax=Vermiconidia calcicola TaxID=1690605 RepID=A0ACC3NXF5_9PEZI|nr:hypothetical protein LTR37_000955 [Vermiconidia calcicola]
MEVTSSDQQSTGDPTEPSRLQKLPAELRNRIYGLALPETVVAHSYYRRQSFETEVRQPSLTRVCKQLRNESLPVFYSTLSVYRRRHWKFDASIEIPNQDVLEQWLLAIGAKNRYAFTCLFYTSHKPDAERGARWLAQSGMVVEVVPGRSREKSKRSIEFHFGYM